MTIGKAIELLVREYELRKKNKKILHPVSYALYMVYTAAERELTEKSERGE